MTSGDFQSDSIDELIERDHDGAIEFVELGGFGIDEASVIFERLENGAGERRIEFLEELQINDADAVAIRSQAIASGFVEPLNETFSS